MHLDTAIGEFLDDLRLAGRSGRTVEGHELELLRLGRWCAGEGRDWRQLAPAELRSYTRLRAHLGHSSRSNMLCSLRTFYRWSVEAGYVPISPAAGFKTPARPRPLPRALTLDQVRRLLESFALADGHGDRRDRALILTALYAGLRAKELAGLRWQAVDLAGGVLAIELSKGRKGRAVPLHAELGSVLEVWRKYQRGASCGPVFSLNDTPITAGRVGKICRRWCERSGVSFTCHMLRHTFATWTLRGSHDLYAVSKALGHSRVQQTEIYLSADVDQVRSAISHLPALAGW